MQSYRNHHVLKDFSIASSVDANPYEKYHSTLKDTCKLAKESSMRELPL